ncbi:MAG: aldolase/citrate lyase family protein [Chloroflexota bacterium]
MLKNALKAAAAEGRTAFGMYVTQPAPSIVEVAAQAGLDFVRIDTYHGTMGAETVDSLIRAAYAAGITPTARVQNDPVAILSVLEQGCMGITVPDVEDAQTARGIVQASRYPPKGIREISKPQRMMAVSAGDYFRWADEELIVSAQIESKRGLDNIEEILAVDGLDMVQSGRNDLSLSLGVPGQPNHPLVIAAEDRIIDAALTAGKMVSISFQPAPDALQRLGNLAKRGVQCITIGFDSQVLFQAMRDRVAGIVAAINS